MHLQLAMSAAIKQGEKEHTGQVLLGEVEMLIESPRMMNCLQEGLGYFEKLTYYLTGKKSNEAVKAACLV